MLVSRQELDCCQRTGGSLVGVREFWRKECRMRIGQTSIHDEREWAAETSLAQRLRRLAWGSVFLVAQELVYAAILFVLLLMFTWWWELRFELGVILVFILWRGYDLRESAWVWRKLIKVVPIIPRRGLMSALCSENDRAIETWRTTPIDGVSAANIILSEGTTIGNFFLGYEFLPPFLSLALAMPGTSFSEILVRFAVVDILYNVSILPVHFSLRFRRDSQTLKLAARFLVRNMNRRCKNRGDTCPDLSSYDLRDSLGSSEKLADKICLLTAACFLCVTFGLSLAVMLLDSGRHPGALPWVIGFCIGLILTSLLFACFLVPAWKRERPRVIRKFELIWEDLWPYL